MKQTRLVKSVPQSHPSLQKEKFWMKCQLNPWEILFQSTISFFFFLLKLWGMGKCEAKQTREQGQREGGQSPKHTHARVRRKQEKKKRKKHLATREKTTKILKTTHSKFWTSVTGFPAWNSFSWAQSRSSVHKGESVPLIPTKPPCVIFHNS